MRCEVQAAGTIELYFYPLPQDTILYLRASKEHQAGHSSASSRWYAYPWVVLVRPNHLSTAISLDVAVEDGTAVGELLMLAGQEGVLYEFRDTQTDDRRLRDLHLDEPRARWRRWLRCGRFGRSRERRHGSW